MIIVPHTGEKTIDTATQTMTIEEYKDRIRRLTAELLGYIVDDDTTKEETKAKEAK